MKKLQEKQQKQKKENVIISFIWLATNDTGAQAHQYFNKQQQQEIVKLFLFLLKLCGFCKKAFFPQKKML